MCSRRESDAIRNEHGGPAKKFDLQDDLLRLIMRSIAPQLVNDAGAQCTNAATIDHQKAGKPTLNPA